MASKTVPGKSGYGIKLMKTLSGNVAKKRMSKTSRMKLHQTLVMGWLCYVRELSLSSKGLALESGSKKVREEDVEKAATEINRLFEEKIDAEEIEET